MQIEYIIPLVLLVASFVQGFTGFGLALISVSSLSLFFNSTLSVPLAGIFGWIVTFPIVAIIKQFVEKRDILLLIIGAIPSTFIGAWLLKILDKRIILIVMGLILIVSGAYFLLKRKGYFESDGVIKSSLWKSTSIGFLSGTLGASVGEPDPPVIAYLSSKDWSAEKVMATLSLFFMIQMIGALVGFYLHGFINLELGKSILWALPGFFVGTFLGLICFYVSLKKNINYHKIVHGLLVIIGLRLLIENLYIINKYLQGERMKYFLDSAKLQEVNEAFKTFEIDSVTTKPHHVMNSGKSQAEIIDEVSQWAKKCR